MVHTQLNKYSKQLGKPLPKIAEQKLPRVTIIMIQLQTRVPDKNGNKRLYPAKITRKLLLCAVPTTKIFQRSKKGRFRIIKLKTAEKFLKNGEKSKAHLNMNSYQLFRLDCYQLFWTAGIYMHQKTFIKTFFPTPDMAMKHPNMRPEKK